MLYNLRSDIIYYKSNSDFEMEFNLCGCCRMRLLTDKPSNKKAFVHSLARAVSRSRVILIAGPLFGDESTIEIVAQALGTETEICDNAAYNITSEDEISIIKGSIPLVSGDGCFGGCIIESGPQTMVLLTDNKTLRKSIMTGLIHPYISELYEAEGKANEAKPAQKAEQPVIEETAEASPAYEEITPVLTEDDILLNEQLNAPQEIELDENISEIQEEINKAIPVFQNIPDDEPDLVISNEEKQADIDEEILLFSTADNEADTVTPEQIAETTQLIFDEDETVDDKKQNHSSDLILEDEPVSKKERTAKVSKNYNLFDDDDIQSSSKATGKDRPSAFNIATIIVTAILLLSIIVLCYCIFAVAGQEGVAPAEYIRTVWQTVFG